LRNAITSEEEVEYYALTLRNKLIPNGHLKYGLALIKPELAQYKNSVHNFFSRLGCNPVVLPTLHLSHDQWMSIYGDRIKGFPEIMFLYVTQRALGMTPVLFRYPPGNIFDAIDPQIYQQSDLAESFNKKYCGRAFLETPGTIRWEVTRPALLTNGFTDMSGYASAFDPFHYFRHKQDKFIFGAFNGIHLPDNTFECLSNIRTLYGTESVRLVLEKYYL